MSLALTPDQTPETEIKAQGTGEALLLAVGDEKRDWFQALAKRLQEVAGLKENWDSYGAAGVNAVSAHYAHCFLSHVSQYQNIEKPALTATPRGYVAFLWQDSGRSVDIEFDEKGLAYYSYESSTEELDGKRPITQDFLNCLLESEEAFADPK